MNNIRPLIVCGLLLTTLAMQARAADIPKPGDEVEVLHLNEWTRGKVISVDRRSMTVEFNFAGGSTTGSFGPGEVREYLEPGTLTKERTWTDATGKFKIKAVLLSINEGKITLRKPDQSEVELEITKLSATDKTLVKNIAKAQAAAPPLANTPRGFPMPPGFPGDLAMPGRGAPSNLGDAPAAQKVEAFATNQTASVGGENISKPMPLAPDPLPTYLKLQEGGAVLQDADFFSEVTNLLPVGGKDMWVLACIGNKQSDGPTRLAWCSLAKKKVEKQQLLPLARNWSTIIRPAIDC